ncbi:hypothetical protein RI054_34g132740 [Pseudoscourfieldia marina]
MLLTEARCGGCERGGISLACRSPGAWMERRWLCKACIAKGVRWQDWEGKQSNAAEDDEGYVAPPTSAPQQHEAELQQLHGRQVEKVFRQPSSGRLTCEEPTPQRYGVGSASARDGAEWRQPSGNREELAVLMHALTPGVSARQVTLTARCYREARLPRGHGVRGHIRDGHPPSVSVLQAGGGAVGAGPVRWLRQHPA